MSILEQLRKSARSAAREGLERLGKSLSSSKTSNEKDYASPLDFLNNYRNIVDKSAEINPAMPVPESMFQLIDAEILPFCGQNDAVRETLKTWKDDRRTLFPDITAEDLTMEIAKAEAIEIIRRAELAAAIPETPDLWLETAQNIAKAQGRMIFNLLLQCHRQCQSDDFQSWMEQMNERLARFKYEIVQIRDGMFSIIEK